MLSLNLLFLSIIFFQIYGNNNYEEMKLKLNILQKNKSYFYITSYMRLIISLLYSLKIDK